jgi:hypothetical protein
MSRVWRVLAARVERERERMREEERESEREGERERELRTLAASAKLIKKNRERELRRRKKSDARRKTGDSSAKLNDGGWITVTKRRRPTDITTPPPTPPQIAQPFRPFSHHTYAQALTHLPKSVPPTPTPMQTSPTHPRRAHQQSTNASPPRQPPVMQNVTSFSSPFSPTVLRYPPSPYYQEWRGRCFHCARFGHVIAECRFPRKYLNCWQDGHNANECRKMNVPKGK